jgi:hypothetical protein
MKLTCAFSIILFMPCLTYSAASPPTDGVGSCMRFIKQLYDQRSTEFDTVGNATVRDGGNNVWIVRQPMRELTTSGLPHRVTFECKLTWMPAESKWRLLDIRQF